MEYGTYEIWPSSSTSELENNSNIWKEKLGLKQEPFHLVIRNNQVNVRAIGITGFVNVNGIDIEIKPKFLASTSSDKWRKLLWNILLFVENSSNSIFGEHSVQESEDNSHFLDLLGWVFLNSIQATSLEGFPRGYVEQRDFCTELRGRIDYSKIVTVLQNPFVFPCIYDEYSEDIIVNRLLKWAGTFLSTQVKSTHLSNMILYNIQHIQADGSQPPSVVEAEHIVLPAQYHYAEPALKIAKMLLRNKSLHYEQGAFSSSGFLWKSHDVYENFIHNILIMTMSFFGNRMILHREAITNVALPFIYTSQGINEYPDFKIKEGNSSIFILDAKYKMNNLRRELVYGLSNTEDINQIIVACKIEKCLHGILIYPSENGRDTHHQTWKINDDGFPKYVSNLYLNLEVMAELGGPQSLSKQMFEQLEIIHSYI